MKMKMQNLYVPNLRRTLELPMHKLKLNFNFTLPKQNPGSHNL